jgi:molecular chaperone DnaK
MSPTPDGPIFGIDLGTTCSAIGWVHDGRPTLIAIHGDELLPSVVSFGEGDGPTLVGAPAQNQLALNPERTVRSAKRHMGTNLRWAIDGRSLSPADVSACILRTLAEGAREATGHRVRRVVITVPAWFTQAQRADTRKAGEAAGFEVLRLVNEPTAAALAHAHGQQLQRRALVYDLGGGTFDVSLVHQDGPVVEVLASHGDARLGGDDFDRLLYLHALERLDDDCPGLLAAVEASPAAQNRLLSAVEQVKVALSSDTWAQLRAPFLIEHGGEPRHADLRIERSELEDLIHPLLERTLSSVDQVLSDAGLEPTQVDELLLVGGSTRIPLVWALLQRRYGLEGSAAIPPERAVVMGAAIQGAIVGGSRVDGVLVDVAPFSLSVGAVAVLDPYGPPHFLCSVVTPRNASLPSRHTQRFYTMSAVQRALELPVFQGGHPNPLANIAMGEIDMRDIPPSPDDEDGKPIDVEFRHDLDGMVHIRITDVLEGREVAGRLAVDGDQVERLRAKIEKLMRMSSMIPGDGSDADPWHPEPLAHGAGPAEIELLADEPVDGADDAAPDKLDEARVLFRAVRRRQRSLQSEHPEQAAALIEDAKRGLELLDEGEGEAAVAQYESLADRLFDLGIFL